MGKHSVVEAKNNLSDLIARAEKGEEVVITRHGLPVVEIKSLQPMKTGPRPMTPADFDWLDARRVTLKPGAEGPTDLLRRMRDEDWR